jgi:uncharacterized membrane protein YeaQ/YmgE (transglycosylase-associated protein family)
LNKQAPFSEDDMKFMGLIVGMVGVVVAGVLLWNVPAKYNHGNTWFYFGTVVGGAYLLLARPFK